MIGADERNGRKVWLHQIVQILLTGIEVLKELKYITNVNKRLPDKELMCLFLFWSQDRHGD